jgi:hypothetical protein
METNRPPDKRPSLSIPGPSRSPGASPRRSVSSGMTGVSPEAGGRFGSHINNTPPSRLRKISTVSNISNISVPSRSQTPVNKVPRSVGTSRVSRLSLSPRTNPSPVSRMQGPPTESDSSSLAACQTPRLPSQLDKAGVGVRSVSSPQLPTTSESSFPEQVSANSSLDIPLGNRPSRSLSNGSVSSSVSIPATVGSPRPQEPESVASPSVSEIGTLSFNADESFERETTVGNEETDDILPLLHQVAHLHSTRVASLKTLLIRDREEKAREIFELKVNMYFACKSRFFLF